MPYFVGAHKEQGDETVKLTANDEPPEGPNIRITTVAENGDTYYIQLSPREAITVSTLLQKWVMLGYSQ